MLSIFNKFQVIIGGFSIGKELWDSTAMFAWIPCLLQHREVVSWREPSQISKVFLQSHSDRMSHGNNNTNPTAGKNDVQKVSIYGDNCTSKGHEASHNRLNR